MMYRQLRQGTSGKDFYKLIPTNEDLKKYIDDYNKDWYQSIFKYNQEHFEQFQKTRSLGGATGVVTDQLVWDFDDKEHPENALEDTKTLCERLMQDGIAESDISISFSGMKGFCITVLLNQDITPEQFKNITFFYADDLKTFDTTVNDNQRILRVVKTKHPKSNLYKIPISFEELNNSSIEVIKNLATNPDNVFEPEPIKPIVMPNNMRIQLESKARIEKQDVVKGVGTPLDITFDKKPKGWSNCKWSLLNGNFKSGNRHYPILCIIATARGLNYPKNTAYYMAKSASKLSAQRHNEVEHDKEEIWNKVEEVYDPSWKGGTFSCRDGKSLWLTEICDDLGPHKCKATDGIIVSTSEVFNLFKEYSENFEKNALTFGIEPLDERCKLMVGTSNGLLAAPGVGKTSTVLNILEHNSNLGNRCLFFSYDMYHSLIYLRLIQRVTGYNQDEIFKIFRTDVKKAQQIKERIEESYKNIHFCFKSGQTPDEIQETVLDLEQKVGEKVKLATIDYNELIISQHSDSTAASAEVAQRLRQIANDTSTAILTLLQPAKIYANPSDEITTYQGAKGSGAIAQSLSLMLSLSRPGFSPRTPETDKFITINALKHRQGPLFTIDLAWDGLSGNVREMTEEEEQELMEIRARKALEKGEEAW